MTEKAMILFHQTRYPLMKLEDHVKRIHQAVFGPGHLHDTQSSIDIENYIDFELNQLRMDPTYLIEPIGESFFRVYLTKRFKDTKLKHRSLCKYMDLSF